jgi:hypothetical protein
MLIQSIANHTHGDSKGQTNRWQKTQGIDCNMNKPVWKAQFLLVMKNSDGGVNSTGVEWRGR